MCGYGFNLIVLGERAFFVDLATLGEEFGAEIEDLKDAAGEAEGGEGVHCGWRFCELSL